MSFCGRSKRRKGDRTEFAHGAFEIANELDAEIDKVLSLSDAEREKAKAGFEDLSEEERRAQIRTLQLGGIEPPNVRYATGISH